jgi:transcriptional regulator with XRE-family HTH domain
MTVSEAAGEPQPDTRAFLKQFRQRIDPEVRALGTYVRLACRRGRPVTQEEIAEAIGVSRVWYAKLESDGAAGASMKLLTRLADVLMLTTVERESLFALAIPALEGVQPHKSSVAGLLESFSIMRTATKRLWAASSESEALTLGCEQVAAWFDSAVLVSYFCRLEPGAWVRSPVLNRGIGNRVIGMWRDLSASWPPERIDELALYPQLSQPGEIGTVHTLSPSIRRDRLGAYARHGLHALDFVHARVTSRKGLIGGFHVKYETGHVCSELDRAVIGTIADLTSMTLS